MFERKEMSILFAILIFEAIIIIHELGHFIAAKASGVKVNEFAIGMGPAIIKKKKGDTLYAWRVFPIGGYCAMEGEDNGSEDEKIIAIPFTDPNYNCYKNINDLPKHVFDEMQHFFTVYKQLEGKNTAVNTVLGREEALSIIEKSLKGYKEKLFEILNK